MRNPFLCSLQTCCGDAGCNIRDVANTEVYRKYTDLYNNFHRFPVFGLALKLAIEQGWIKVTFCAGQLAGLQIIHTSRVTTSLAARGNNKSLSYY